MQKFLGKFRVHTFIHNPRRGKIGIILENSTKEELHIGWFSGKKQIVKLNPGNKKEANELKRISKLKALEIGNFTIQAGLPTRVLKILKDASNVSLLINTESICIPGQELNDVLLTRTLLELMKIEGATYSDVSFRKTGDTIQGLVRFWSEEDSSSPSNVLDVP